LINFKEQYITTKMGEQLGKWLIFVGGGIVLLGLILLILSKMGLSLGKLPGDISVKRERVSFHFPIATSIVISIVLTVFLNLIIWIFRK